MPLALVDNGVRWHVRAFDRLRKHFTDFVPTRMEDVEVLETSPIGREERADQDDQWSRIIELKLVPHPNHPRPEIVQMDYPMQDGVFTVKVRSANAGYMLRRWNVDCSRIITSKVLSTRFGFKILCLSTDPPTQQSRRVMSLRGSSWWSEELTDRQLRHLSLSSGGTTRSIRTVSSARTA